MKKILISIILLISIFSCTKNNINIKNEISITLGAEPRTLDPTLNSLSFGSIYMIHFFEGLTKKDKDDNVVAGNAYKWDISEDGIVYTFYIRDDAKWSDGKNVSAKDFEYAIKRAANPKTAATYSYMLNIIKNANDCLSGKKDISELDVKAVDDNTLQITLENPTPYFLEYLSISSVYFPVREDIIEKYGDKWTLSPETYVVNGPYYMTERKFDEKITMEENPYYYDKKSIIAKKINSIIIEDSNTALSYIKNGDIQFSVIEAPLGEIEQLKKDKYILQENAYGIYFLAINTKKDVLTNKNIRKALALAFDRNYIISNVTKLNQIPANAWVAYGIKDYDNITDFRVNGSNYIDSSKYNENIQLAKKLLEEAGYTNGEGFPVLEIRTTPGYFTLIAEAMQSMYKENLNIDIIIKSEMYNETFQAMVQKEYDLARTGWTADFSDALSMLNYFSTINSVNHTGFESDKFQELLKLATKETNNQKRMEALHKAEDIIFEYMPIIPIIYRLDPFMISPKLKGAIFNPLGRYIFTYSYIED